MSQRGTTTRGAYDQRVAGHPPTRDAERSKARILAAAEELFATHGFERVRMADIGAAAGLSRGTPAYYFGSKQQLYLEVLATLFDAREVAIADAWARLGEATDGELAARLREAVAEYLGFLHARPTFIAITEREALAGAPLLADAPRRSPAIQDALTALATRREFRVSQALMVVLSVGMFPLVHRETVLAPRGIDPSDPIVLERHIELVTDLTLAVIEGRAGS